MSFGSRPLSGLPKVIAGDRSGQSSARGERPSSRGVPAEPRRARSRALRAARSLLLGGLVLGIAGCSRTARPVPVPEGLAGWPTPLETPRRDAWLREVAPERPERAWTVELGRGVVAPLAVEADLVFATTVDRRLIVLAAGTGSFFWERRLHGAASAGAVFDDSTVFVATQDRDGTAEAYELARGFLVWRREIAPPLVSPLLRDGVSIWGTERGGLYALGTRDGSQLWRLDLSGGVVSTPIPDGGDLLVATNADTLYRIEARTGRITARLPLPSTPAATGAFDGASLHFPMHDTTHLVIDVRAWRVARVDTLDALARTVPQIDEDGGAFVLTENGSVWRIHPVEGAALVAPLGGAARASLALASNGLLVGRLDGALFLIRRNGTVVWREDFDDSIEAPVAVYRGAVYVPLLRGELVMLREAGS